MPSLNFESSYSPVLYSRASEEFQISAVEDFLINPIIRKMDRIKSLTVYNDKFYKKSRTCKVLACAAARHVNYF